MKNITVSRYPLPSEIAKSDFEVIINVSDEYIDSCQKAAKSKGIDYFWFPLSEVTQMGLNSIYGALQILYIAHSENKKVLLHCHAGACRSVLVYELFAFLINGAFSQDAKVVYECISENVLPNIENIKIFLCECKAAFEQEIAQKGGCLDAAKITSNLRNI